MLDAIERDFEGDDYYEELAYEESWDKIVELGLDKLTTTSFKQLSNEQLKELGLNDYDIELETAKNFV